MSEFLSVATSFGNREGAVDLARLLVEEKLAACVQVAGPVKSTYSWKGEVLDTVEWLCTIKTKASLYSEVESAIVEHHHYDVPEIIATPIVAGSTTYLDWLTQQLKS
jgi:periplasmic divalent cation tolerance protein